jgi:predicted nucleotidyltransferase
MKTLEEILQVLREHKAYLHEKYHVSSIAVYGSVARREATPDSDVDILVEFDDKIGLGFVDLALDLEQLLGLKVDLASKRALRPEVLQLIADEIRHA